jgi:hypothetical protein
LTLWWAAPPMWPPLVISVCGRRTADALHPATCVAESPPSQCGPSTRELPPRLRQRGAFPIAVVRLLLPDRGSQTGDLCDACAKLNAGQGAREGKTPEIRQRCAPSPARSGGAAPRHVDSPALPPEEDQLLARPRLTPADASGESSHLHPTTGATATPRPQESRRVDGTTASPGQCASRIVRGRRRPSRSCFPRA